jgi:predicted tellurium resistance membrane protein TerC
MEFDFAHLITSDGLLSLVILIILEVVLGIDNVIFVSIIMDRLPQDQVPKARRAWMISGILVRSALLMGLSWLLGQKGNYLFTIPVIDKGIDIASLVMLIGGTFLIYKTVMEIHAKLEGDEHLNGKAKEANLTFMAAFGQIILIDMIFSFDSIITAGGTAKYLSVMIVAVVVAMIIMFLFSPQISSFIHKHPTIKMLALSFLVMIGIALLVEGWDSEKAHDMHLKNYIYFAMAFSFLVELLNLRMRKKSKAVELHEPMLEPKFGPKNDQAN